MSPSSGTGKICIKCGVDCSNKPRTKDSQGRYYCQSCYEAAKQQRAPAPKPTPRVVAKTRETPSRNDDRPLNLLDQLIASAPPVTMAKPCPSCGSGMESSAIICTSCGYNMQTGTQLAVKKIKGPKTKRETPPILAMALSPIAVGLAIGLIYVLLFALSQQGDAENGAMIFSAWHLPFVLCVSIFVLVIAFMEGIGTGFLTMCLPFYVLYFIYGVTENRYAKVLFTIYLVAHIVWIFSFRSTINSMAL